MPGRLDHTASARTATAKGSAGDTAVGRILLDLGWAQVADLARTFPGADLIAFCACEAKHELWAEVKTYPIGKIKPESWGHIQSRCVLTLERPRADFRLFTYQRANGRPKKGQGRQWWVSSWPDWAENSTPLKNIREAVQPPCASGSTLVSGIPHRRGVLETRSHGAERGAAANPTQGQKENRGEAPAAPPEKPSADRGREAVEAFKEMPGFRVWEQAYGEIDPNDGD